jgi:hypothetical protein
VKRLITRWWQWATGSEPFYLGLPHVLPAYPFILGGLWLAGIHKESLGVALIALGINWIVCCRFLLLGYVAYPVRTRFGKGNE